MGDEAFFDDSSVRGEICLSALYSMVAKVYAMRYGAHPPWLEDQMVMTHFRQDWADYENPVVVELRRVRR